MHTSMMHAGLAVTCAVAHLLASRFGLRCLLANNQRGEDVGEEVCDSYRVSHFGSWLLKYLNTMCQVRLLSMPVCGGGTCVGEISCGYSTGATCVILLSYIRNC